MLLSLLLFTQIFGYHPFENSKELPISKSTERLMGPDFKTLRDTGIDAKEELCKTAYKKLEMKSDDGLLLKASYFRNEADENKTIILVHGHNSHSFKDNSIKALQYIKAGFSVLMPDNRACGESEGKWETFGAKESCDILKWIEKLIEIYPDEKIVVDGCSMGGATVCLLSDKQLPANVRALISDCAFVSVENEFKHMIHSFAHLPAFPLLYTVEFWNKRINKLSYADQCPITSVSRAKAPMVFVHGREDRYIPYKDAEKLYNACPQDKLLIIIENAGHAASCVKGGDKYFEPILDFINKHM